MATTTHTPDPHTSTPCTGCGDRYEYQELLPTPSGLWCCDCLECGRSPYTQAQRDALYRDAQ